MNRKLNRSLLVVGAVTCCWSCVPDSPHEWQESNLIWALEHDASELDFRGEMHAGFGSLDDEVDECEPACWDSPCGEEDGCGGFCKCPGDHECQEGECVEKPKCANTPSAGCCVADLLFSCDQGVTKTWDCATGGKGHCGWNESSSSYTCATKGLEDPTGHSPKLCPGYCAPLCSGKFCGPNGCGGECGICPDGWSCESGSCHEDATPYGEGVPR